MNRPSTSRGMALMSAIFLMVVLLALGISMVSVQGVQQDTGNKALLAAKVYYGARAGLEWGMQRAISSDVCVPDTNPAANFTLAQGGVNGVVVKVNCVTSTYGAGNNVYTLTSVATIGSLGGPGYAERRLQAVVSNLP